MYTKLPDRIQKTVRKDTADYQTVYIRLIDRIHQTTRQDAADYKTVQETTRQDAAWQTTG